MTRLHQSQIGRIGLSQRSRVHAFTGGVPSRPDGRRSHSGNTTLEATPGKPGNFHLLSARPGGVGRACVNRPTCAWRRPASRYAHLTVRAAQWSGGDCATDVRRGAAQPAVVDAQPALRGVSTLRAPRALWAARLRGSPVSHRGCAARGADSSSWGVDGGASLACWTRAARSSSSSLVRQQCLYFFPEPQWHDSLRPGRFGPSSAIAHSLRLLPYHRAAGRTKVPGTWLSARVVHATVCVVSTPGNRRCRRRCCRFMSDRPRACDRRAPPESGVRRR